MIKLKEIFGRYGRVLSKQLVRRVPSYWSNVPVLRTNLAKFGFYYTGYKDAAQTGLPCKKLLRQLFRLRRFHGETAQAG